VAVGPGYPMTSRPSSRLASPAMSRKSLSLRRKRSSYAEEDPTDDEDSDEDDRRSIVSNRSGMTNSSRVRHRRISSASQMMNEDLDMSGSKSNRSKYRNQRRPSIPKSLQGDWLPNEMARRKDSQVSSSATPSKIYSDLESEGSGARALVQAKIQQKLQENSSKANEKRKVDQGTDAPPILKSKPEQPKQLPKQKPQPQHQPQPEPVLYSQTTEIESEEEVQDDESEEEEHNGNQSKNAVQQEVSKDEQENLELIADEEASALGPPPSTPDYEWTCEFCTFVNEPKVKICAICCKTPSTTALKKQASPESILKTNNSAVAKVTKEVKKLEISQVKKDSTSQKSNGKNKKISFLKGTKEH